jgi:hypothetical protein
MPPFSGVSLLFRSPNCRLGVNATTLLTMLTILRIAGAAHFWRPREVGELCPQNRLLTTEIPNCYGGGGCCGSISCPIQEARERARTPGLRGSRAALSPVDSTRRSCLPTRGVQVERWPIDRFVFYARNPRKNAGALDRMCASTREFGFKVPVLARSDGTVVDGYSRLKAARKLGSWPGGDRTGIPVILTYVVRPETVRGTALHPAEARCASKLPARSAGGWAQTNGNRFRASRSPSAPASGPAASPFPRLHSGPS